MLLRSFTCMERRDGAGDSRDGKAASAGRTLLDLTMVVGTCTVCGTRFMRASSGRPRITCSHACRQDAYRRRHPLGWRMIAELELPDRSPLEMLREAGVRGA